MYKKKKNLTFAKNKFDKKRNLSFLSEKKNKSKGKELIEYLMEAIKHMLSIFVKINEHG